MKIADLGVLDATLALFGGPYSNAQATADFFKAVALQGVRPEATICTGDVVAYCGNPRKTIDLIRASGCKVVAGNCERQLAARASNCGCGFGVGTACDLLSAGWFSYANAQVSDADRAWMKTSSDIVVFAHQGARYAVIHGGITDISRFLWPTSADDVFEEEIAAINQAIGTVQNVIAGHSGIPFQREIAGVRWINVGAIGIPPNDGRQMTRYAILDGGEVRFYQLHYDVKAAVADMRKAGLVQGYEQALVTGYWPSEDVLPPDLRSLSFASG